MPWVLQQLALTGVLVVGGLCAGRRADWRVRLLLARPDCVARLDRTRGRGRGGRCAGVCDGYGCVYEYGGHAWVKK